MLDSVLKKLALQLGSSFFKIVTRFIVPRGHLHSYLGEVAAKAGRPAALGAGAHTANVLLAQDLVTALRVGAPGQVGAALNIAPQESVFILKKIDPTHIVRIP